MKILFTADLHIKLGQKNVPIEWSLNRYKLIAEHLNNLQSKADIVVLGGDIFDKLPNMQELEVYFDLVTIFNIPTYIYSGNHEAIRKDTTFLSNLSVVTNKLNKNVVIIDKPTTIINDEDKFDIIPYTHIKTFTPDNFHSKILCTHVRGDIPPHVKAEIDLDKLNRWEIVLAGDLHSYENSQRNIIYPGSPATTSFHRSMVDTGVVILDTTSLQHEFIKLNVPQLIKRSVSVGDPTPATDYHHTIYELEGTLEELAKVEDSELIEKKSVKRSSETTLILDPKLSLSEEVREYLTWILELNEESINEVINELQPYITGTSGS